MASSQVMLNISAKSQERLISFLWHLRARYTYFYSIRGTLEAIDKEYYRESNKGEEHQRARLANNLGDASRYQDVTVPIVMDQVDTWTAFMAEVFCSGTPMFPVVAPDKYMDAAMMMNTLLDNQARKGRWKSEFIKFFRDCAKYSLGAVEVSWDKVNTAVVDTDLSFSAKEGKPRNIIWEGNTVTRWDLYNSFWDNTVLPQDVAAKGEYAGKHDLMSRNSLKQLVAKLGQDAIIKNIGKAFSSQTMLTEYYVPQVNPEALASLNTLTQGMDWFSWAGIQNEKDSLAYKGLYIVTTLYARILPSDFEIQAPQPNTPQVWKFIIVNFQAVIYIERQTNAHEMIPVFFGCPNDDGIKYQTKSLAQNMKPYQQITSALMNSVIASRRRAIADKGIYNPNFIERKHIESPNPAAKIPLKPSAYAGISMSEVYMPIPFSDDQAGISMQEVQVISAMADTVSGQNKAQRGQFVKGNKTAGEYQDIMGNADSKPKMQAIVMEDQVFTPIKHVLGLNILQFQGAESLFHEEENKEVQIDPLILRNAIWQFKITDGAIPTDREMHAEVWQVGMQMIGSSPAIQQQYEVGKLFSYMMKVKGADIRQFEKAPETMQYEQAVAAWQNTVMQIVKANPEATQQQFPPQPLPQQFGIGPDGKPLPESPSAQHAKEESSESLVQKLLEATNGQEEATENVQAQQ